MKTCDPQKFHPVPWGDAHLVDRVGPKHDRSWQVQIAVSTPDRYFAEYSGILEVSWPPR